LKKKRSGTLSYIETLETRKRWLINFAVGCNQIKEPKTTAESLIDLVTNFHRF
jgi:hypothetical protein